MTWDHVKIDTNERNSANNGPFTAVLRQYKACTPIKH